MALSPKGLLDLPLEDITQQAPSELITCILESKLVEGLTSQVITVSDVWQNFLLYLPYYVYLSYYCSSFSESYTVACPKVKRFVLKVRIHTVIL